MSLTERQRNDSVGVTVGERGGGAAKLISHKNAGAGAILRAPQS
jgi:hypothetical protein